MEGLELWREEETKLKEYSEECDITGTKVISNTCTCNCN